MNRRRSAAAEPSEAPVAQEEKVEEKVESKSERELRFKKEDDAAKAAKRKIDAEYIEVQGRKVIQVKHKKGFGKYSGLVGMLKDLKKTNFFSQCLKQNIEVRGISKGELQKLAKSE